MVKNKNMIKNNIDWIRYFLKTSKIEVLGVVFLNKLIN